MIDQATRALVVKHEGWRLRCYRDGRGIPTIGVGYNLTEHQVPADLAAAGAPSVTALVAGTAVLTNQQVATLLDICLKRAMDDAMSLDAEYIGRPPYVQRVLVDMLFTLGRTRAAKFTAFWAAIARSNYDMAATALQHSIWYNEATNRVSELVALLRTPSTASQEIA